MLDAKVVSLSTTFAAACYAMVEPSNAQPVHRDVHLHVTHLELEAPRSRSTPPPV